MRLLFTALACLITMGVIGQHSLAIQTLNHNAQATEVNNPCIDQTIGGCILPFACNYNPEADYYLPGSCDFSCLFGMPSGGPCFDPLACNFGEEEPCEYLDENGEICAQGGCNYPEACNFDSGADFNDGSCECVTCQGCTDPQACNYNPTLSEDDGSCEYLDALGICGGDCDYDIDNDGICDPSCLEDVDNDGIITVNDLLLVLSDWGCIENCTADTDGDGLVSVADLLNLLSVFGETCE